MSEPRRRRGEPGDDRGIALLLTALGMVALLVIAALVVDVGFGKQFRRQSQATADASALAAAQYLGSRPTPASQADLVEAAKIARDLSIANEPQLTVSMWAGCAAPEAGWTVPTGATTGSCVSFKEPERLVRVVLPRVQTPGFFGGVVGEDGYEVNAAAQATWGASSGGTGACGICAIGGAMFQQSNGTVKIDGGRQIHADRLRINNPAKSNEPDQLGWWLANDGNNQKYDYYRLTGPVQNPFEAVKVDYTGVTMHPEMNADCDDLVPNKMYRQTVNINGSCTLPSPGIYYFKNGIQVNGTLKGDNVTLVFGCATGTEMSDSPRKCNGSHTGNVNLNSSGGLQLGAPYYEGMSLLWDETASAESVINFNGNIKLGGAYYSKNATPQFHGGTFVSTGIVFGGDGKTSVQNGGNIQIIDDGNGGGTIQHGAVSLYR
jgi:hypothetical protein